MKRIAPMFVMIGMLLVTPTKAEVVVSGLIDVVVKQSPKTDFSNETFFGFSNFHTLRARLFFDAALSDQTTAFVQVLTDRGNYQLYAAYARLQQPFGVPFNLHVGLIPAPVGTFAARAYSTTNPLIGVPLVYNYHSIFNPAKGSSSGYSSGAVQATIADLLADRTNRANATMPVIYDNCWNSGIELFGSAGKLDFSLGLLAGSLGYPSAEQPKDVPQVTTRLAWNFAPGLVVAANGFAGPYLWPGQYGGTLPAGKQYDDYLNYGGGYDLYIAKGQFEIYSELYHTSWQHPTLPTISIMSGYGEAKYTFAPGWYLAGRGDLFEPSKETTATGSQEHWDYPVRRVEVGIGHKLERTLLMKLVFQHNHLIGNNSLNHDLIALQTSVSF